MMEINVMDEMEILNPVEEVVTNRNLAGAKGFLLGAAVVGAGVLMTYSIKKLKKIRKDKSKPEVIDVDQKEE